jgi:hypothetical protein
MQDKTEKLFAGQVGVCAVLINILLDKGVISQAELRERLEQAHAAAALSSGGPECAAALAALVDYLAPNGAALDA